MNKHKTIAAVCGASLLLAGSAWAEGASATPSPAAGEQPACCATCASGAGGTASPPLACLLDAAAQRARADSLWAVLGRASTVEQVENGLRFSFSPEQAGVAELARIMELERDCCRFFRFTLIIEPDNGPLRLELSGPEGTREFLLELLPELEAALQAPL